MITSQRIPGLDGIRALSVSMVIFAHLTGLTYKEAGRLGVDCFFVLSGFLITFLLCQEEQTSGAISLSGFYSRRCLRILPPAIVCIAFTVLLGRINLANVAPQEQFYCLFFVRNLMLNGGIHLSHFWSLAIEEQFYLIWPLAFILLKKNRNRIIFTLALFCAQPFWQHIAYRIAGGIINVNTNRFDLRYGALMAGCCLAVGIHEIGRRENRLIRFAGSEGAGLISILLIAMGYLSLFGLAFSPTVTFIAISGLINVVIRRKTGLLGGALNWKPLVWIGHLSYSLYLWQQIFCSSSMLPWVGKFPQNVAACLATASLSYYLVERPIARMRKQSRCANSCVPIGGIVHADQSRNRENEPIDVAT